MTEESGDRIGRYSPFIIIIVVLALAAGAGVWWYQRETNVERTGPSANRTYDIEPDPAHARGEKDAPITLEEFGDFQCPTCAALHASLKTIDAEPGPRIRLVFREFPLTLAHKHSLEAAHAAEAAGLQGRFWEMHDLLYEDQKRWTEAADVKSMFIKYAGDLGLDVNRFTTDMDGIEVSNRIIADQRLGQARNVNYTPTVFLNGHEMSYIETGSTDNLRAAILAQLNKNQRP
jgi:protein-disulfide isomerase